VKGKLTIIPHI